MFKPMLAATAKGFDNLIKDTIGLLGMPKFDGVRGGGYYRRFTYPVPCDHLPIRSWLLFRAQAILWDVIESEAER
jgi:hypothetical protein